MSSSSIHPSPQCGVAHAAPRGGLSRYGNLVLGGWLFASALLWPHGGVSRVNALLTGLALLVVTLSSLRWSALRWLSLVPAAWLAVSSLLIWHPGPRTLYNHLICALLVVGVCFCPDPPAPPTIPRRF